MSGYSLEMIRGCPLVIMADSNRRAKKQRTLRLAVLSVFLLGLAAVLKPLPGSAHIPITTKIMFDKEVIRILQRNCLECHRPGGSSFSLASYADARPWAKAIEVELLEGRMPPWRPVKGFGDFIGAPAITQQDIDLVVNWVENGVPEGNPKDLPPSPLFSDDWRLGPPDVVLKTGTSPSVKPGADEYATFTMSTGLKEDRWIGAIDLRPGNGALVQSAAIYLERNGMDSAGGRPGAHLEEFGTWLPGQTPYRLERAGWLLPAGSRIVLKIHYHGSDDQSDQPATDSSQLGIYLTKKPPPNELVDAALNCPDELIPVSSGPRRVAAVQTLSQAAEIVGIRPAASPLIASLQATAYKPDGTEEVLIWALGSGSDSTPDYYLRRPEMLPKGTRIEVAAYLDNSDSNRKNPNSPAKQLRWPDISSGPLCSFLLARPESTT